jgi:hypothetical protein
LQESHLPWLTARGTGSLAFDRTIWRSNSADDSVTVKESPPQDRIVGSVRWNSLTIASGPIDQRAKYPEETAALEISLCLAYLV